MAWREVSMRGEREEFVGLARMAGANVSELCRRFGVSRSNGNKWLHRYTVEGASGLEPRSRRPHSSPGRTKDKIEQAVLEIRDGSNGAWGGRKIAKVLTTRGMEGVPGPSTITGILRRHDRLERRAGEHPGPYRRFEREAPNELWQMDFKGHIGVGTGRCHPLTVLDDHARYSLGLQACANQQDQTVRERLTTIFERYGMPLHMLMDNGSPWGDAGGQPWTTFGVWLARLGIRVSHGRPYHPQTQGKDERFHRTLKAEVLEGKSFADLEQCQRAFDTWRHIYNHERPHEALGMGVPADRYQPSPRSFPATLPAIEYGPTDQVRKVDVNGFISFKARFWRIGKPFKSLPVALQPTTTDGVFAVRFCAHPIGMADFRTEGETLSRPVKVGPTATSQIDPTSSANQGPMQC